MFECLHKIVRALETMLHLDIDGLKIALLYFIERNIIDHSHLVDFVTDHGERHLYVPRTADGFGSMITSGLVTTMTNFKKCTL